MAITTSLVQTSFKKAHFEVVSSVEQLLTKYTIKVYPLVQSSVGSDAITTDQQPNLSMTLNENPTILPIVLPTSTITGAYRAHLTLYSDSDIVSTTEAFLYYDTRTLTVKPVEIDSVHTQSSPAQFRMVAPTIRDATDPNNVQDLAQSDTLYTYLESSGINLACTRVLVNGGVFAARNEYDLGMQTASNGLYAWNIGPTGKNLPIDSAYEVWGYINLAFKDQPSFLLYDKPTLKNVLSFVANDAYVGYHLSLPDVEVTLGDVVGTVSANPIVANITNFSDYTNFPFSSVTVNIRDNTSAQLFSINKPGHSSVITVTSTDLASIVNGADPNVNLSNGVTYKYEFILHFDDADLFKPVQTRSVIEEGQFDDRLLPVTQTSVLNSWQANPAQGNGLVISFRKSEQFMGNLNNQPYNLDKFGVTRVFVEYNVLNSSGALTQWLPMPGGSISQSSVNFALDSNNTDGKYSVPLAPTASSTGTTQDPVYIYAVIPDQAKYNLVQVRLTLSTTNTSFGVNVRTSAPVVIGSTNNFPYTASVRYFPKPAVHDFSIDKPVINLADQNGLTRISFNVPVSVPPYHKSVVTTSGGTVAGTATVVMNNPPFIINNAPGALSAAVTGLSYTPTASASFQLSVAYEYIENGAISTAPVSTSVQMQGFSKPADKGFIITSAEWNQTTQKVDYVLNVSATGTSAVRMDGWTVYTKLSSDGDNSWVNRGNVLRSAGLSQSLDLNITNSNFVNIQIRFTATRSKFLSSSLFTEQTETNSNSATDAGSQSTTITILPSTLPKPLLADISVKNSVYNANGPANQYATVEVNLIPNVDQVQLKNMSDSSTSSQTTNPSSFLVPITATPTNMTFEIRYRFMNYTSGVFSPLYSSPTILVFKTSFSSVSAPLITRKSNAETTFDVDYTYAGSNYTDGSAIIATTVMEITDVYSWVTDAQTDDGKLDLAASKGKKLTACVASTFDSEYKVDGENKRSIAAVKSPSSAPFYVADNPSIVSSSIVVNSTNNTITFDVRNNGDPFFNTVFVLFAQDPGSNEGDKGTFGIALFENSAGFTRNGSQVNLFRGGLVNGVPTTHAHTLTVTAITGTDYDYDKITTFTFQSASDLNTTNANVVLYVANGLEGSDSLVMADLTPIS